MFENDNNDGLGSIHLTDEIKKIISRPLSILKVPGELMKAAYQPLAHTLHQVETHVIQPYLKPLIKPVAKIMPKITIAGHVYDLGGSQMLQKSATGAVAGFAVGGVYGAVAGAVVAGLIKGKPDVANNLMQGLAAGAAVNAVGSIVASNSTIAGTGMTPAQMASAGATPTQIAEISAAANAPGGIAANAALMPSVGTIPGTGMTAGEMAAAGASSSDISAAITNAYTEIPGTGMTPSQMIDAGATPQQVSEITQAANAPGGITNAANSSLMPSVGEPTSFISNLSSSPSSSGLTASEVTSGVGTAGAIVSTGIGIGKATGLIKDKSQGADQVEEAGLIPSNMSYLAIGITAAGILGVALYLKYKKK